MYKIIAILLVTVVIFVVGSSEKQKVARKSETSICSIDTVKYALDIEENLRLKELQEIVRKKVERQRR